MTTSALFAGVRRGSVSGSRIGSLLIEFSSRGPKDPSVHSKSRPIGSCGTSERRGYACWRNLAKWPNAAQFQPEIRRMNQSLEAQLQATLNMIPAYTWYAGPSGGLAFVNQGLADYLGLPADHPLRTGSVTDAAWDSHIPMLHPDDQDATRRAGSACLGTGTPGAVSCRVRSANGDYRWFLSRTEPLRARDGTLLGWIGINLDVEEHKQAEMELRRSKEYLADAQRLTRTGAVGFDASTNRIFWS